MISIFYFGVGLWPWVSPVVGIANLMNATGEPQVVYAYAASLFGG